MPILAGIKRFETHAFTCDFVKYMPGRLMLESINKHSHVIIFLRAFRCTVAARHHKADIAIVTCDDEIGRWQHLSPISKVRFTIIIIIATM